MPAQPAAPQRRVDVPHNAPEKVQLCAFLDWYRDTLLRKVSGLSREQLTRRLVPSPTTLLGLVKHLAYVERTWFGRVFAGQDLPDPWTKEDPDVDFRIEPGETAEGVIAFYREECDRSRRIVQGASLDDVARLPGRDQTLRWILIHMIEETARHAGHVDILRELTDGAVGQ